MQTHSSAAACASRSALECSSLREQRHSSAAACESRSARECSSLHKSPACKCCSLYFAKCTLEPIILERNSPLAPGLPGQPPRKCRENGHAAACASRGIRVQQLASAAACENPAIGELLPAPPNQDLPPMPAKAHGEGVGALCLQHSDQRRQLIRLRLPMSATRCDCNEILTECHADAYVR